MTKATRVLEVEFLSCFLMGIGFGMIAEAENGLAACTGTVICAVSLCMMLCARSLRDTLGKLA
jgi:hypothetical protein